MSKPSLAHKSYLSFFTGSFIISALGLVLAGVLGWLEHQTVAHALQFVFLCFVLSLLEVSISFDNAVVNATVLRKMTPIWQRRFLTWGILIAVFGMRLVFPLLIVCISAWVGPIEALKIATFEPQRYADMMLAVHHEVAAFGGAFLALVALKYFFDSSKEIHWISFIEAPLARWGRVDIIEVGIVLVGLWVLSKTLPATEGFAVLQAGVAGIITFVGVETLGEMLQSPEGDEASIDPHKASLGMFLYLEVLDASFSFDGVIGAFAITNHLFLIAIGLGIGALFVRSLTIMMVEKGALDAFVYLEHGAFWAVGSLAMIMFLNIHFHIPEVITGLIGVTFIGLAIWSSWRLSQKNKGAA